MSKAHSSPTVTVVRDASSGQFVAVRGVGAPIGRLAIKKGVDLTKPIASQAIKGASKRNGSAKSKH